MAPDSAGDAGSETAVAAATTARPSSCPRRPFPCAPACRRLEPEILERLGEPDLYNAMRNARQAAGAPLFVLHDGPPYANGAIHIGHALQQDC